MCCFSQNTYVDNLFAKHCMQCDVLSANYEKIELDTPVNTWHNAHVSFKHEDYEKAQYYLLKDTKTANTLKQLFQGHLLLKLGIYDEAKINLINALRLGSKSQQQMACKSLGDVFYKKKEYDSTVVYYQKAFEVDTFQSTFFKNEIYENLAYISLAKEEYTTAETYYRKILRAYIKQKDSLPIARAYSHMGNLYFEQYKDQIARKYFDSAYVYLKNLKDLELKIAVTHNLYFISELLKEPKTAIRYFKEYTIHKDSLQQQNMVWEVAQEREMFNIGIKQVELKAKTAQRNTFFAIAIGAFLLALIAFYAYRNSKQKNQQIVKLNTALTTSNATKNQLFSIVAHDLRAPIAHLKQRFESKLSQKNYQTDEPFLNTNYKAVQSVNQLVDNLLNWSLSQSNLIAVHPEWFPLKPIIDQVLFPFQSLIEEKKIKLEVETSKSILIFADINTIKIALRNCIDNAIKFTPGNGSITISGNSKVEKLYTLSIEDSGIGISKEIIHTLFEVDAKKIKEDTSGHKSTGLGLVLTKAMIEKNNGTLAITANTKIGTTVNVTLPFKFIS
jgi:signal transduction histidine kinase